MICDDWTYGAEHELGDWPRDRELPEDFGLDKKDVTIVNSNGIAADPKGRYYRFGGEINTPPTGEPVGQCMMLAKIKGRYPEAVVNYRSNLHVHVRVPGLQDDLKLLKQLTRFNQQHLRSLLPLVEPIPMPCHEEYSDPEEQEGAMKRFRRRLRSHHTMLTDTRVETQLQADNTDDFFHWEVPWSNGEDPKPLWHFQPRCAVNLRQMLETDTIEFRHFPGTLNEEELLTCVEWCQTYLVCAFTETNPIKIFHLDFAHREWPKFPKYIHWMEKRYQATTRDGSVPVAEVIENIKLIEAGEFDDQSPCTLPR
jgi:hypothetical protein